jgi:hypothetical protein
MTLDIQQYEDTERARVRARTADGGTPRADIVDVLVACRLRCHYMYFCTSKASKNRNWWREPLS